ncbi:MAG: sigma-70 family RNA polymerase sigma factor [Candidatus Pseudobacter hemicellulosilyticus]|uniref:Sigma-70 family RNA polymerase sigma factor n=1 Tax=Candidatus Pseudobacter hemicellulosilyticus TaxID=3121375 RepID=A0AAJ5WZ54_9BACT|nr:MAG: sigma-70 family RNA polymerase sigma factor [Pseudobacter sp.]
MALSVDELLAQFREGSETAFKELYNIYFYRMYCFTKSYVNDTMVAEDIVAELFVKLWKMNKNFESKANLEAFLHIAARNAAFNHLDMYKRRSVREKELLRKMNSVAQVNAEIESEVVTRVRRAIDALSAKSKQVVLLSYFEGYSNGEIAAMMNITDKTVRNIKVLALKKIKLDIFNKDALMLASLVFVYILLGVRSLFVVWIAWLNCYGW